MLATSMLGLHSSLRQSWKADVPRSVVDDPVLRAYLAVYKSLLGDRANAGRSISGDVGASQVVKSFCAFQGQCVSVEGKTMTHEAALTHSVHA